MSDNSLPALLDMNLLVAEHEHGVIGSRTVLHHLFRGWLQRRFDERRFRKPYLEPLKPAFDGEKGLRNLLRVLADDCYNGYRLAVEYSVSEQLRHKFPVKAQYEQALQKSKIVYHAAAHDKLREQFRQWSQVADRFDLLRIFFAAGGDSEESISRLIARLERCPNRTFLWSILSDGLEQWPTLTAVFQDKIDRLKLDFAQKSLEFFKRLMPIAEIDALLKSGRYKKTDLELIKEFGLLPSELSVALSEGALQLDGGPQMKDNPWFVPNMRLCTFKVNPLFL
ncbi:MAG: hypothetical protein K2W82_16520 [Candidatus Obscuribacterales bacterium]|nr:hypothetical protein [Candidatus Obscuribacterales bacterium]